MSTKPAVKTALSAALKTLGDFQGRLDDRAKAIFNVVRNAKIRKLEAFNEAVALAYADNGWHTAIGKPKGNAKTQPAPRTVRTYVWEFRTAFKLGLPVGSMTSLYELRQAVAANRKKRPIAAANDERPEELKGVSIRQPDTIVGAVFHDIIAVYANLPEADQQSVVAQLNRILHRYQRQVNGSLRLAA